MILTCTAAAARALAPQTGAAVPELSSLDRDIPALMEAGHVPGGAVAIVKDGRLIFAHGYGLADTARGEAFQPDSLCRTGSVSKTVTAVTILRLVESGKLRLDDRAFSGILVQLPPPGTSADPRLKEISIRQLPHHTGGHGRDTGVDPLNIGLAKSTAEVFHTAMPPGYEAMVRYALGLPLDFDPGTKYSYSNYGFTALARVVERVTGQKYEDAVRRQVLAPMGIRRMAVGQTLLEDRLPGEVRYYDVPCAPLVLSLVANVRHLVPPYANFELEAGDGSGRWIGSAVDLARFVARVELSSYCSSGPARSSRKIRRGAGGMRWGRSPSQMAPQRDGPMVASIRELRPAITRSATAICLRSFSTRLRTTTPSRVPCTTSWPR